MTRKLPDDGRATVRLVEHRLSGEIIRCFYRVYEGLGYGFLESVYRRAIELELREQGLGVLAETPIVVRYRGCEVGNYRLDLLVENRIAVEVKATELLAPTAKRQLLNYLRAGTLDVGLLLHFGPEAKFHRLVSPRFLARDSSALNGRAGSGSALARKRAKREERTRPDTARTRPDTADAGQPHPRPQARTMS